ncbi:putative barwin-like endoglucanase protein [Eutypa lata UCREL1]|uniref:Putative barwin-like endoglucanase protein n=1 Tax=Eutypa lata (strain UCR-EL1) TaxID=1287681 RepID=M7SU15_EUTLA|nr:putative barwin-like endoglucanase protein [Eutypa lata UCREL1]
MQFFITSLLAVSAAALPSATNGTWFGKRVTHSGIATYYYQGGAAGSCGNYHADSDLIIALSPSWDVASFCGRKIQITNAGGGQDNNGAGTVIQAVVQDTCPGCDQNHLDLSTGAFEALTGGNLDPPGQFNINWNFCNANGQC